MLVLSRKIGQRITIGDPPIAHVMVVGFGEVNSSENPDLKDLFMVEPTSSDSSSSGTILRMFALCTT